MQLDLTKPFQKAIHNINKELQKIEDLHPKQNELGSITDQIYKLTILLLEKYRNPTKDQS